MERSSAENRAWCRRTTRPSACACVRFPMRWQFVQDLCRSGFPFDLDPVHPEMDRICRTLTEISSDIGSLPISHPLGSRNISRSNHSTVSERDLRN